MQCNKIISVIAAIGCFVFSVNVLAADPPPNAQGSKTKKEVEKAEKNLRDVQGGGTETDAVLSSAEIEKKGRTKR